MGGGNQVSVTYPVKICIHSKFGKRTPKQEEKPVVNSRENIRTDTLLESRQTLQMLQGLAWDLMEYLHEKQLSKGRSLSSVVMRRLGRLCFL